MHKGAEMTRLPLPNLPSRLGVWTLETKTDKLVLTVDGEAKFAICHASRYTRDKLWEIIRKAGDEVNMTTEGK